MFTKYFISIVNLLLNNNFLQFSAKVFKNWFKNNVKLNEISHSNKKYPSLFLIDTGQDTVPKHKIKNNHGQSRTGGLPSKGGYFSKFSKRLKTVLMVFKMLNEGYFEMFYQKELKNSDILRKIPFLTTLTNVVYSFLLPTHPPARPPPEKNSEEIGTLLETNQKK